MSGKGDGVSGIPFRDVRNLIRTSKTVPLFRVYYISRCCICLLMETI